MSEAADSGHARDDGPDRGVASRAYGWVGTGIGVGAGGGAGVGAIFGQPGSGAAIGAAVGVAVGGMIAAALRRRSDC